MTATHIRIKIIHGLLLRKNEEGFYNEAITQYECIIKAGQGKSYSGVAYSARAAFKEASKFYRYKIRIGEAVPFDQQEK